MEETDARLECLRLAAQDARQTGDHSPDKVVKRAHAYADFVLGVEKRGELAEVPQKSVQEDAVMLDCGCGAGDVDRCQRSPCPRKTYGALDGSSITYMEPDATVSDIARIVNAARDAGPSTY